MLASTLLWLYFKYLKVQHTMQFITFSSQFLTVVLKQDAIFTRLFFPPECSFPFPFPRANSVCPFNPHLSREETTATFIFLLLTIVFIGLGTRHREKSWLTLTCCTVRVCYDGSSPVPHILTYFCFMISPPFPSHVNIEEAMTDPSQ